MKTNLHKTFKTNQILEKDGVDYMYNDEVSFKVRRFVATNPRVKEAMAHYYKPYARQLELGTLSPEKTQEIQIKLFIDVCLVSWKGLKDESGKDIEYSKQNALEILQELPDLFDSLWKHANDFENYKEDVGNF